MTIKMVVPLIGDANKYVGLPILDSTDNTKNNTYDSNVCEGQVKAIGIITKILEIPVNNEYKTVLVEAEIWDRFVNVEYETSVNNDNKQLSAVYFGVK